MRNRLVLDIHGIGPKPAWVDADEDSYWCEHPETYERILDQILEASARNGMPIELTFDDGNISDATIAAPALSRRGLTGSFFVCAGRIGQPGYLDRSAMADMLAAGMKIGSHGWSHIDWRKTDDATLELEVSGARHKIEDTTGMPVDAVAIPFGSYDRRVMSRLGGFTTIYTSDGGLATLTGRLVPRISYRKDWAATTLATLAADREGWLTRARRSLAMAMKRLR